MCCVYFIVTMNVISLLILKYMSVGKCILGEESRANLTKQHILHNISKMSASVLQGFPHTRKLTKKHEAQVFEMASQSAPNCKQQKTKKTKIT